MFLGGCTYLVGSHKMTTWHCNPKVLNINPVTCLRVFESGLVRHGQLAWMRAEGAPSWSEFPGTAKAKQSFSWHDHWCNQYFAWVIQTGSGRHFFFWQLGVPVKRETRFHLRAHLILRQSSEYKNQAEPKDEFCFESRWRLIYWTYIAS
jgi:hypothetical protein